MPDADRKLIRALQTDVTKKTKCLHDLRKADISDAIRSFVNTQDCALVITTGGTGPARRDVTPEATLDVLDRELPGFGERMYGNFGITFDPFLTPC